MLLYIHTARLEAVLAVLTNGVEEDDFDVLQDVFVDRGLCCYVILTQIAEAQLDRKICT